MKPRFLLDEHVNRAIQRQLRRLDLRIEELYLIWAASTADEYEDSALFIPL